MDASRLGRLARALAGRCSRRRWLGVLAALPLGGGPGVLLGDAARAERPIDRVRDRTPQRNTRQRRERRELKDERQDKRARRDQGARGPLRNTRDCGFLLAPLGCKQVQEGAIWVWDCPQAVNLTGADLSSCNLLGAHLVAAILNGANLSNADLSEAKMDFVTMDKRTSLANATLVNALLRRGNMLGTVFDGANLRHAFFTDSYCPGASFADASLIDANFQHTNLTGAILRGATAWANFEGAILQDADLRRLSWCPLPQREAHSCATCPDGEDRPSDGRCCGHLNGWTTPNCV